MEKPNFPDYTGGFDDTKEDVEEEESTSFDELEEEAPKEEPEEKEEKDAEETDTEKDTKETEKEIDTEEEVKEEKKEEEPKELSEDEKIKEDLINYVKGEDGTGSTKYVVKGKEYDLNDLTPDEIKSRFALAGRAWETMEENATTRKQLDRDRETLDRGASTVNDLMRRYGDIMQGKPDKETIPSGLEPSDIDSDGEKALKEIALQQHREIEALKTSNEQATYTNAETAVINELQTLKKEFSCGSPEEVIAYFSANPSSTVSLRDAMEASHRHYMGDEFLDTALKARPDKVRELKETVIKEYLAKKGKSKPISRRKSSSTASSKVAEKTKSKAPTSFDEIEERREEIISHITQMTDEDE